MSELKADLPSLDEAASNAENASLDMSKVVGSTALNGVLSAMESGSAGIAAQAAGIATDNFSHSIASMLTEFANAITSARNSYDYAERQTEIDFTSVNNLISGVQ